MNIYFFILIAFVFGKSSSYKPTHQVERLSKSIFSNKKCKETFTPARYKIKCNNFKFEQPTGEKTLAEQYFPDVEYPTNIMEIAKPFFYRASEGNGLLGPFPDEVQTSFRTLMDKNKKSLSEVKAKYVNDYMLNSKVCMQITPKPQTNIEDNATVSISDSNELVCIPVEIINEELPEDESSFEDQFEVEELAGTFSEVNSPDSQTVFGELAVEKYDTPVDMEDVILDSQLGSWESEQIFSFEIYPEERPDGNSSSMIKELPNDAEELAEEANNSRIFINGTQEGKSSLIAAPEYPEDSKCLSSKEMKPCDGTKEDNVQHLPMMRNTNSLEITNLLTPLECKKCRK